MSSWMLLMSALVLGHLSPLRAQNSEAGSPRTVLVSQGLPMNGSGYDFRQMPYVGNGHLATVVKSDTVYVTGVYNGRGANSHRARIPSHVDIMLRDAPISRNYSLDTVRGYFMEVVTTNDVEVTFQTFAHSRSTQLLITIIKARRLRNSSGRLNTALKEISRNETGDFDLVKEEKYNGQNEFKELRTKEKETDASSLQTVYVYNSALVDFNNIVIENGKDQSTPMAFIMSIDTNRERARTAYDAALVDELTNRLLSEHVDGWRDLWSRGYISVDNNELQGVIDSSFYYVMSSVRFEKKDDLDEFYGISSDSLSRGALGQDRQGHIYRDAEQWIFPAMLMFHSDVAEVMLYHRYMKRRIAGNIATADGKQGYRFPSDSALTGSDLSSPSSTGNKSRIHINGDIAFAIRQLFSATRDVAWLNGQGCDLAKGLAEYWNSRIVADSVNYDINQVTDPNDDSRTVDNSAYLNVAASSALKFARLALCICNRESEVDKEWVKKANLMELPFDDEKNVHLEYKGFLPGADMKELGAVMLGFPLMYNMSSDARRKGLEYYSKLVGTNGPSTVNSMLAIGYSELNDTRTKTDDFFEKSYKGYMSDLFKVWYELPEKKGSSHFLPGAGAFLQALLYGYGGVRVRYDRLELNPQLPPKCNRMDFFHLDYLDAVIDVTVQARDVIVRFHNTNNLQFTLYDKDGNPTAITENGKSVTVQTGKITIKATTKLFDTCLIPEDIIEKDPKTSQLGAASRHPFSLLPITSSLLVTLLMMSVSL